MLQSFNKIQQTCAALLAALVCGLAPCSLLAVAIAGEDWDGIVGLDANAQRVRPYEKFEVTFDVPGEWSNPFDPDEIAVDGVFQTPEEKTLVQPGFFYQDYQRDKAGDREQLTPVGKPAWKVRFTPVSPGTYRYRLRLAVRGKTSQTDERTFVCEGQPEPQNHGFLRVSKTNPYYFDYDDGTPFFAVGENIATLSALGSFAIDQWYGRLAGVGGNFVRSWWCSGGTDLESRVSSLPDQGLGRYKLDEAWRIDYLVNLSQRLGIRVMCCLETQQYLRREQWWKQFSYNAANGGPVTSPADFFVNPKADEFFRKRLRYIVARWSYSPAVFSWQFWNEVSACNDFQVEPAAAWHERMARYLRSIDPYRHIIHTNFGNMDGYQAVDGLPEMEVVSTNIYSRRDMGRTAVWGTRMITDRYRKPYLLTEYGVGHRGGWVQEDPTGVIVHNGLWGAVVSGSAGAGMPWGWDHWVDKQDMYHYWQVVSDMVRDVPFSKRQWKPAQVEAFVYEDASRPAYYASVLFEGWPRNYSYTTSPKPLPTHFNVSAQGEVDRPESFDAVLYSKRSHELSIDFPVDGKLVVHVPEITPEGKPILEVSVDGSRALSETPPAEDPQRPWDCWKAYPVAVPAGHHEIQVTNAGSGGLWTAYELQDYLRRQGPDLEIIGLQSDDCLLVWVRNPQYVWLFDREGRKPSRQEPGLVTFVGISDGEYSVQWRETTTGDRLGEAQAIAANGRLVLRTPPITRSAVVKLVKN